MAALVCINYEQEKLVMRCKLLLIVLVLLTGCNNVVYTEPKTSSIGLQYRVTCIEGYRFVWHNNGLAGPLGPCLTQNFGGKK